jgi:hypothetical protein
MATLYKFDGVCCSYCGSSGPIQSDHVIPRSRGGSNKLGNLVPACTLCNQDKSNMTPEEWRADREANGLSWPPFWEHSDCKNTWDEYHQCVEHGRVAAERNRRKIKFCTICGDTVFMIEWCKRHYRCWQKYGDPKETDKRRAKKASEKAQRDFQKELNYAMSEWRNYLLAIIGPRLYFCEACGEMFRAGIGNTRLGMCRPHAKRFERTGFALGKEDPNYVPPRKPDRWYETNSAKMKAQWSKGGSLRSRKPWDRTRRD